MDPCAPLPLLAYHHLMEDQLRSVDQGKPLEAQVMCNPSSYAIHLNIDFEIVRIVSKKHFF